jgi:hypothetical protein
MVFVSPGYLQVLADMLSQKRILVVYGDKGNVLATRVLEAPIGLLDSREDLRQALMLRRSDRLELVTYQWHWQPY